MKILVAVIITGLGFLVIGCGEGKPVSRQRYELDELQKDINKLKTGVAQLQVEIGSVEKLVFQTRIAGLSARQNMDELAKAFSALRDKIEKLDSSQPLTPPQ